MFKNIFCIYYTATPLPPAQPSITSSPTTFLLGDDVTLTCGGSSATTYEWKKDDFVVQTDSSADFEITSFASSNTGSYVCTATNAGGSTTSSSLLIEGKPKQCSQSHFQSKFRH